MIPVTSARRRVTWLKFVVQAGGKKTSQQKVSKKKIVGTELEMEEK